MEPISVKEIFSKQFNGLQLVNPADQRAISKLSAMVGAGQRSTAGRETWAVADAFCG
jgi:hypothetical protein